MTSRYPEPILFVQENIKPSTTICIQIWKLCSSRFLTASVPPPGFLLCEWIFNEIKVNVICTYFYEAFHQPPAVSGKDLPEHRLCYFKLLKICPTSPPHYPQQLFIFTALLGTETLGEQLSSLEKPSYLRRETS